MSATTPTLYIIDGYSLIYRSYFAFINRPLRDLQGNNVSALFGFFNTLFMLLRQWEPTYLAVAMDTKEPTFRHKLYDQYKANRDAAPQDLHEQVPRINAILEAAHIPRIGLDGWEADDVIASLIRRASKAGVKSVMVTGDKDLLQLVSSDVSALRPPRKGESSYRLIGEKEVEQEFGIKPSQIVDYLALIGDSSDNVPGVAGIGPKGALKLLSEHPSLEAIYAHINEFTPSVTKKLRESEQMAFLSKTLVTLQDDIAEIDDFHPETCKVETIAWQKAIPLFEEANAASLVALAAQSDQIDLTPKTSTLNIPATVHLIDSIQQLQQVLKKMGEGNIMAFDFETTSVDEMEAVPVGFSFTNTANEAWYVPFTAQGETIVDQQQAKELLKELIVNKNIKLVGQNLKYDYKVLRRWGIESANLYFDTMIAAWMLDSASGIYHMDHLAKRYLDGYETIKFQDVVAKGSTFDLVPLDQAVAYGAEDAFVTWRLYEVLAKELAERQLDKLFAEVEMPLVHILAEMELCGIAVDKQELDTFSDELAERIQAIENQIYDEVGHPFNINSTKQLQEVLFEERNLPPVKKIKTGYSTDTDTLEQLAHLDVVPNLIVQNRGLVKLKNTYVDTLPQMIHPQTGRIHTSFSQTGTATGRLSSRNPNLQNIPIRSEDGRRIREAFVPSSGSLFLSADYAQIELVVLAHLADDDGLKEAFLAGEDIHTHTASLIFDTMPALVLAQQRRIAKTINFGVMYGMSAFRLSNELQITRKEAQTFIDDYFARFSKVKEYMQNVIEVAKKTGAVKTLLGRQRYVPEILSRNKMEQAGAERIVVNTSIQGSAADIMKLAMLRISKRMEEHMLSSRLLLQVHDELIFEVPEAEIEKMKIVVQEGMQQAYQLSIPLKVSLEIGSSWGQMH
ncbi:MAG: DNA polymerase I [Sphaerochaetaceae bacterium]